MKYPKVLSLLMVVVIIILLKLFLPSEKEYETDKMKSYHERNEIEKQLVGKWVDAQFLKGLKTNRNYHLLSANASYTYRGSDNSKRFKGSWSVRQSDSMLFINRKDNKQPYKIIDIQKDHIDLVQMKFDSLTYHIKWVKRPYVNENSY